MKALFEVLETSSSPSSKCCPFSMQASVRGKLESVLSKAGKYYSSVAHFERMWWDKGSDARKHVSIWRPVVSTGYAMLGDFVTDGYVGCSWFLVSFNWQ
jgi:hypothetical protein